MNFGGLTAAALLLAVSTAVQCVSGRAAADELDSWCAQVKKASSIVICSDSVLRQQAIARNQIFEAARSKLSADAYKVLLANQTRWIKTYTARCGVGVDDPPPAISVPQAVIECYRRELVRPHELSHVSPFRFCLFQAGASVDGRGGFRWRGS